MHIYLVDDDRSSRMILEGIVGGLGYKTKSFSSGAELLATLAVTKMPTIILIDWDMPGISGIDILGYLDKRPIAAPIYKIMVSAKTKHEDIAFALKNGADDFVSKPYDATELRARINVGERLVDLQTEQKKNHEELQRYTHDIEKIAEDRARQLVHADRLMTVGTMSAGIAHEINNPTTFISINLQTIEEYFPKLEKLVNTPENIELKNEVMPFINSLPEIINEMKNGVKRIRAIVSGITSFVHDGSQKGMEELSLVTVLNEGIKICANRFKKGVELKTSIVSDDLVIGNKQEIEQVIVNLLVNAVDALEEGNSNGAVLVTVFSTDTTVSLRVEDSGVGISEENKAKLFTPFFTTKEVGKGTGLGLAISSKIIQEHQGTLTLSKSDLGGAAFTITLPRMTKEK